MLFISFLVIKLLYAKLFSLTSSNRGLFLLFGGAVSSLPFSSSAMRWRFFFIFFAPAYQAVHVFQVFCTHRNSFYKKSGESPNFFVNVVRSVFEFQRHAVPARHLHTPNNKALLFLICYPTYNMLSPTFNISVTTVKEE